MEPKSKKPISPDREHAMRKRCHLLMQYPPYDGRETGIDLGEWQQAHCCPCTYPSDCKFFDELPKEIKEKINDSPVVIRLREKEDV